MDQGTEGKAILKTAISIHFQFNFNSFERFVLLINRPEVEVLNVDVLVGRRFALAPEEETLLGRHLLHRDVLDGEAENDGPDHTQRHLRIPVHDFYT